MACDVHVRLYVVILVIVQLIESRDKSGLDPASRDYIRLKTTIANELQRLEHSIKDLADTHKKEVEKMGCVDTRLAMRGLTG